MRHWLLALVLALLAVQCPGELLQRAGCRAHRELLVVVCEGLNTTSLAQQLTKELAYTTSSLGIPTQPWVHELNILSGRLLVLDSVVPAGIVALQRLHQLQVIRCQLRQVTVGAMLEVAASLRHLSFAHNKLVAVPAAVSLLKRLETLDLRHNAITRISPLLARLPRLRTIRLDHNRIRQMSGWPAASSHLTHLGLADNLVHEVWLQALSSLPALQWLDLSQNLLQRLSPDISLPPALSEIDLRGNPWHCDCSAAWLPLLKQRPLVAHLPECTSPHYLRRQPLDALSVTELCTGFDRLNGIKHTSVDLTNQHMKLSNVSSRTFELSWNVSDISQRGRRVQEYLGWRVTFRKFGEHDESEVLLITLAGEDASRKTGTSTGQYTVRNLTPDTGYLVCINALTDGEVNNIIETERNVTKENGDLPLPTPHQLLESPRSRSLNLDSNLLPNDILFDEWQSHWGDKLLTTVKETTSRTTTSTSEATTTSTTSASTSRSISSSTLSKDTFQGSTPQNFVYTNTGQRIPINFGPPGIPIRERESLENFNIRNDPSFIRNVPPPPPPTNFAESNSKFPFSFVRKKRSLEQKARKGKQGRCIEVQTPREDLLTMPVTVAATASSSTTMVIVLICCCCFPKRCNTFRSSCTDKCKSLTRSNIITTNSKTKTFVKDSKVNSISKIIKFNKSASSPDLRMLHAYTSIENDYYPNLNKYYTMHRKDIDNFRMEVFPGYDMPKNATAKFYGYDFPRSKALNAIAPRRLSTDDNTPQIENDRFHYYNLNKFKANLNIPIEQCKYSEGIKGLSYCESSIVESEHFDYQKPAPGPPRKISNRDFIINGTTSHRSNLRKNLFSRSAPDLKSIFNFKQKTAWLHNNLSSKSGNTFTGRFSQNNPGYENHFDKTNPKKLQKINLCESTEARLEVVRHIDLVKPKRPTILNINNQFHVEKYYVPEPIVIDHNDYEIKQDSEDKYFKSLEELNKKYDYESTNTEDYWNRTLSIPKKTVSVKEVAMPSSLPVGEIAVTGGILVEVPEGYVLPAKPRPINVLRLKVPADSIA